jgi:hypothetical protein
MWRFEPKTNWQKIRRWRNRIKFAAWRRKKNKGLRAQPLVLELIQLLPKT